MAEGIKNVLAMLGVGEKLLKDLDNAKVDYISTIKRMSMLRSILVNKKIDTYHVFSKIMATDDVADVDFAANTIMILAGTNLELSFNDKEVFFAWDVGDPLDEFPFFRYKVKNTGTSQTVTILSLIRGST